MTVKLTASDTQFHDYTPNFFFLIALDYFILGMDTCIHPSRIFSSNDMLP